VHNAVTTRDDHSATVLRRHLLHACADVWRFGAKKWNTLALHVRSHQSAVRVVVLKEWDERRRNGDELLRRDINVLYVFSQSQNELASLASAVALVDDVSLLVEFDIGLADYVLVLFPSG